MHSILRGLRIFFAILVCKLLRLLSRLLHRGGTAMPGRIACRICPDLLGALAKDVRTVAVTGTNGKTTCSRMIEEAFRDGGLDCFANRSGANLLSGVTTEFVMNATLFGRMRKKVAVIECDEAAARTVFGLLQPEVIVVTNLFRDQLDRYGEITHTLSNIRAGVRDVPGALLCLNADCSLTASLSLDGLPNPICWYGLEDITGADPAPSGLSDASHCIRCKAEYRYEYRTYAHLGGFCCPSCGYRRPATDYTVTKLWEMDDRQSRVTLSTPEGDVDVTVNLPAVYNIYNAAAAFAAARSFGVSEEACRQALGSFSCGFGRMENFPLGGGTRMILVKNPAGCSQALEFLSRVQGDFVFAFCLNDRDADGTDISWIWDANFESLLPQAGRMARICVSGDRGAEMKLRLKYAGLPEERIEVFPTPEELTERLAGEELPIYVLPTYTAMLDLRKVIVHRCGGAEFWE